MVFLITVKYNVKVVLTLGIGLVTEDVEYISIFY